MTKKAIPTAVSKYMATIGHEGGKSKSEAKVAAARKNGQKGGWPKGKKRKQQISRAELEGIRRGLEDVKAGRVVRLDELDEALAKAMKGKPRKGKKGKR